MLEKSKEFRNSQLFLRNQFLDEGYYNIPIIRKQNIDLNEIKLISFSDTHTNDNSINKEKGVHFFIDDNRFESIYKNPSKTLKKLSQYKFVISIDFSLFQEMPRSLQIYNTFRNRWIGAFWQSNQLTVVPCISWSDNESFKFCFSGVEEGSIVAIGMIGCKKNKKGFLNGYYKMIEVINPSAIIVFGKPFPEMYNDNIIEIDYLESRKVVRNGR